MNNKEIDTEVLRHMDTGTCSMKFPNSRDALEFFHELAAKAPETVNYPLPNVSIDKTMEPKTYELRCFGVSRLDAPKP